MTNSIFYSFVQASLTNISNEETFLQERLVILKRPPQNY